MPDYDIYVLSNLRDYNTINHFINQYTDRSIIEDRINEELMVLPVGRTNEDNISMNDYEWIPAINIEHVINFGISQPARAFRFYLPTSLASKLAGVVITFTTDNRIIYGISIEIKDEDETDEDEALIRAEEILITLFNEYQGITGGIFVEEPPSLDSKKFKERLKDSLRVI